MAVNLNDDLLEEIALEGLDGITLNTLWIRLAERKNFPVKLDDSIKTCLWQCILSLKDVEYFTMSHPRPDYVPYNRFHYVDPETRHFLESEQVPEDIYPIKIVDEAGILGSCVEYKTRQNVSVEIQNGRPMLDEIMEKYGNRLVIVAAQTVREQVLIGYQTDTSLEISNQIYCILERIGRSRYSGVSSCGKMSLQAFNEPSKTMFYHLKNLRYLNVIKKQRLCLVKKPSNVKISCFLYQLAKFYVEIGNKRQHEMTILATYLSEKPEQMEEVLKVKQDLNIFDKNFKKVSQMTDTFGKRFFSFIDVPFREKHPNARPKEYMQKNGLYEKMIRHIKFLQTMEEFTRSQEIVESSDDEYDEDVSENSLPGINAEEHFVGPNIEQVMNLIRQTGSRGVTLMEVMKICHTTRLHARRLLNICERKHYVKSVMQDRGRQKVVMYIAVENFQENVIHKKIAKEFKNFTIIKAEPKPETQVEKCGKSKGKKSPAVRPHLEMKFDQFERSEQKVNEIQEELERLDEDNSIIPQNHEAKAKKLQFLKNDDMDVQIEEQKAEVCVEKQSGNVLNGMGRFKVLTESHIRRINWIYEVITAIQVVESFRLLKLLRSREKEMNVPYLMDSKSLKRLVVALVEEKKMVIFKVKIRLGDRTREIFYYCDPNITPADRCFQQSIDQAKLRYFSISKDVLKNSRKAAKKELPCIMTLEENTDIPPEAKEVIEKHQLYRRQLEQKVSQMKYNKSAAQKYGILPKMLRIKIVHELLFYLCYDTHCKKLIKSNVNMQDMDAQTPRDEVEPPVYCDEMSWKRYLPPIRTHAGYPKGWCLINDVILNLPVSFICNFVSVCYDIDGLTELLSDPKKRFYPVINIPLNLAQPLLHAKKYVHEFHKICSYLAEMGLLSFGTELVKHKEQTFIYLHQNASLLDTRTSLLGYNKTRCPNNEEFPVTEFHFTTVDDLVPYWEMVQMVALSSNLAARSMAHEDFVDKLTFEKRSLKEACSTYLPSTVQDLGVIPGDMRGAAGLDSSIFVHTTRNWRSCDKSKDQSIIVSKEPKVSQVAERTRETVDMYNKNRLKGKERLFLSENSTEKPVMIKTVKKDHRGGNKGGKGVKRFPCGGSNKATQPKTMNTHARVWDKDGKILKRRQIKIPSKKAFSRKKPWERGDDKDRKIYRLRSKQRVVWSTKEDSVLLICRLASLIIDKRRKISLLKPLVLRDYLHDKCGEISSDKTSWSIQRRVKFVLSNPQTEANLLVYYREAIQDDYVSNNYLSKNFVHSDKTLPSQFRTLADYLTDKFKSLDLQKCALPETVKQLQDNYTIQVIGKLTSEKEYKDVTCKADIRHDVLRNILHSAVVLQDKQGRTHEMFKLLTQYPDVLLSDVVKELRHDGLLVINKKVYQQESLKQLQAGIGLRNFKVSQRYLFNYKNRHLSSMFEEAATFIQDLCQKYVEGNGDNQRMTLDFNPKTEQCSVLLPLLMKNWLDFKVIVPQEQVMVDMEGFYNFPWGRGKIVFASKGDKFLQNKCILQNQSCVAKLNQSSKSKNTKMQSSLINSEKSNNDAIDEASQKDLVTPVESATPAESITSSPSVLTSESVACLLTCSERKEMEMEHSYCSEIDTSLMEFNESGIKDHKANEDLCKGSVQVKEKKKADTDSQKITEADSLTVEKDDEVYKEGSIETVSDTHQLQTVPLQSETFINKPLRDISTSNKLPDESSQEYICTSTKNTKFFIPKKEVDDFASVDLSNTTSIASRTLLSLRRTEDCSFEDIRIFNAQDNFVVQSCEISIKIQDPVIEDVGATEDIMETSRSEIPESDKQPKVEKRSANGNEYKVQERQNAVEITDGLQTTLSREAKMKRIAPLMANTQKIKQIWSRIQKLVPFQLDVNELWTRFRECGMSEADLALHKKVYATVESHGELGIRSFDLQNTFEPQCPWQKVLNVLVEHDAILKVGVTYTRYVTLNNGRPWVIHAYRNIKGRGLHVDEEHGAQTVPMAIVEDISRDTNADTVIKFKGQEVHASDQMKMAEDGRSELTSAFQAVPDQPLKVHTINTDDKIWKNEHDHSVDKITRCMKRRKVDISDMDNAYEHDLNNIVNSKKHKDDITDMDNASELDLNNGIERKRMRIYEADIDGALVSQSSYNVDSACELTCVKNNVSESDTNVVVIPIPLSHIQNDLHPSMNEKDTPKPNDTVRFGSNEGSVDLHYNADGNDVLMSTADFPNPEFVDKHQDANRLDGTHVATADETHISLTKLHTSQHNFLSFNTRATTQTETKSGGVQTRATRKRKLAADSDEENTDIPAAISTYDTVRLIIQPWRKPEGGINKPIMKMMLESVMLHLMMNPGSSEEMLFKRYQPYLQPMVLRNLIDILEDIGCVTRMYIEKSKPSLFSKISLPKIGLMDDENSTLMILPTEECLFRLGQFGLAMYPNAKWPSSSFPNNEKS